MIILVLIRLGFLKEKTRPSKLVCNGNFWDHILINVVQF